MMPGSRPIDLSGTRYGSLVALAIVGRKNKKAAWLCQCDCGKTSIVTSDHLRSGKTKSCGCTRGTHFSKLNANQTTHGKSYSTEYKIWQGMMQRCHNTDCGGYAEYGGRGIFVCDEWHTFEKFYADMGPRPSNRYSLDRLNNDGPYSPANCEWRTLSQQQRNRRDTVHLTIDGTTKPLSDWAEEVGVPHQTIRSRLLRGWSHKDAVKVQR